MQVRVVGASSALVQPPVKVAQTTNDLLDFLGSQSDHIKPQPQQPQVQKTQQDLTLEVARRKLVRFLLALVTWWEVDFVSSTTVEGAAPKVDLSQQFIEDTVAVAQSASQLITSLKQSLA